MRVSSLFTGGLSSIKLMTGSKNKLKIKEKLFSQAENNQIDFSCPKRQNLRIYVQKKGFLLQKSLKMNIRHSKIRNKCKISKENQDKIFLRGRQIKLKKDYKEESKHQFSSIG